MQPSETWAALAAEHGYADQAHLTREFRAFGAEPPTQVFSADWTTQPSCRACRVRRKVSDPFKTDLSGRRYHRLGRQFLKMQAGADDEKDNPV